LQLGFKMTTGQIDTILADRRCNVRHYEPYLAGYDQFDSEERYLDSRQESKRRKGGTFRSNVDRQFRAIDAETETLFWKVHAFYRHLRLQRTT